MARRRNRSLHSAMAFLGLAVIIGLWIAALAVHSLYSYKLPEPTWPQRPVVRRLRPFRAHIEQTPTKVEADTPVPASLAEPPLVEPEVQQPVLPPTVIFSDEEYQQMKQDLPGVEIPAVPCVTGHDDQTIRWELPAEHYRKLTEQQAEALIAKEKQ